MSLSDTEQLAHLQAEDTAVGHTSLLQLGQLSHGLFTGPLFAQLLSLVFSLDRVELSLTNPEEALTLRLPLLFKFELVQSGSLGFLFNQRLCDSLGFDLSLP